MTDARQITKVAAPDQMSDGDLDANALVAANLRAIRARRGCTQTEVAARLSCVSGGPLLPQASISAMEIGCMNGRRRRFDADELYCLAEVFDVPVVYLLLPSPEDHRAAERMSRLLGPDEHHVDDRLRQLSSRASRGALGLMAAMNGGDAEPNVCLDDYRGWRTDRLEVIERELWTDLDRLADLLAGLADALRACGPVGFLRHLERSSGASGSPCRDETTTSRSATPDP